MHSSLIAGSQNSHRKKENENKAISLFPNFKKNSGSKKSETNNKPNIIHEMKSSEPLDEVDEDGLIINKMRVHFFFTEDDSSSSEKSFWKFLLNTEIEIRITDGPYWEGTLLASTTGYPL